MLFFPTPFSMFVLQYCFCFFQSVVYGNWLGEFSKRWNRTNFSNQTTAKATIVSKREEGISWKVPFFMKLSWMQTQIRGLSAPFPFHIFDHIRMNLFKSADKWGNLSWAQGWTERTILGLFLSCWKYMGCAFSKATHSYFEKHGSSGCCKI